MWMGTFPTYHLSSQIDLYHFDNLFAAFDTYISYEIVLFRGTFNIEISELREKSLNLWFLNENYRIYWMRKKISKSMHSPGGIDLTLTNNVIDFQIITSIFTGLWDFHKLVLTALKRSITENKLQKITYIYYKKFDCI